MAQNSAAAPRGYEASRTSSPTSNAGCEVRAEPGQQRRRRRRVLPRYLGTCARPRSRHARRACSISRQTAQEAIRRASTQTYPLAADRRIASGCIVVLSRHYPITPRLQPPGLPSPAAHRPSSRVTLCPRIEPGAGQSAGSVTAIGVPRSPRGARSPGNGTATPFIAGRVTNPVCRMQRLTFESRSVSMSSSTHRGSQTTAIDRITDSACRRCANARESDVCGLSPGARQRMWAGNVPNGVMRHRAFRFLDAHALRSRVATNGRIVCRRSGRRSRLRRA